MTYSIDFHTHSNNSFDNRKGPSPHEIIHQASYLGMNAIAITDHDFITFNERLFRYAKSLGVLLIPGCEVTTSDGHLIALGITEQVPDNLSAEHTIKILLEQHAFIIAAHPFDEKYGVGDLVFELKIDAIEVNGSRRRPQRENKEAKEVAKIIDIPFVGGSDAHSLENIGSVHTIFEDSVSSLDEILILLKSEGSRIGKL
ncbi:MAG: PHP domain-containing protein [Candidatus Heimdallarchaeota archaeon]|nr:PHP domain-containing protein [Candidatus Heimdallarchaeota archaeon]